MTILFAEGVAQLFEELPRPVQGKAAKILDLIEIFPEMYPIRRRGLMKGYHYFQVFDYIFYYSVSSSEVRVSAILHGPHETGVDWQGQAVRFISETSAEIAAWAAAKRAIGTR